ncbi:RICIN domain-containing protein [Streptococcus oriscaviae]|uniref:RICIN domain-containing protein n=1 Tax=Streptococcus oriscaviae TaxID=2781599 RepID=A0ABX7YKF0_9STRE|nr:RICIN domain-containing protein [Streptococcus oriscaviae]QUE54283.1 RICIN domain-containing protein [Streptococcus oriscaviae]
MFKRKRKRFKRKARQKAKLARFAVAGLASVTIGAVGMCDSVSIYADTESVTALPVVTTADISQPVTEEVTANTSVTSEEAPASTTLSNEPVTTPTSTESSEESEVQLTTETSSVQTIGESTTTTTVGTTLSTTGDKGVEEPRVKDVSETTTAEQAESAEKTKTKDSKELVKEPKTTQTDKNGLKELLVTTEEKDGTVLIPESDSTTLLSAGTPSIGLRGDYRYSGCVQWVKDRSRTLLGIVLPNTGYNKYGLPGASAYWTVLPRYGYQTGSEPAKNAVAVWEHNPVAVYGSNNYGHVAFVEDVNGDHVTISQGGVPGNWGGHLGVSNKGYSKSQVAGIAGKFLGYVYLREKPAPPPPPAVNRYNGEQLAAQVGRSVSDGDYHIVSTADQNLGVDVQGANPANGTNVWLWDSVTSPHQIITVKHLGGGSYTLVHKATGNSMDATSAEPGANVNAYALHGAVNQQWILKPNGDSFEIVNRHSGLVLDIAGGKIAQGTNIQLWEANNSIAQKFKFVSVDTDAKRTIADGTYHIISKFNEQMGLNEAGGGTENYSNAQINSNLLDSKQKFDVKYLGNGYYTIISKTTGRQLDAFGNSSHNGSNVVFHNANNSEAQQWIIKDAGGGFFEIISKKKNMALDTDGSAGVAKEGGNVQLYIRHKGPNQLWRFAPEPQSIKLSATEETMLVGSKRKVTATVSPSNASSLAVSWKSTNPSIVTVNNGELTAVSAGQADIIVTTLAGDKIAVLRVTVNKKITPGWRTDAKGSRYQYADGRYHTNGIKQIDGKWYFFNASGYMSTGWQKVENTHYYFKSSGAMAANEWIDHTYYVDISGKWIPSKKLATPGWKKDSKGYWYQYADATYHKNGMKQIGGKWYYFNSAGYMSTGWQKVEGRHYYFKSSGAMAANEWIDHTYYVDISGKWIPSKKLASPGWKKDAKGYWYQHADATYPKNAWRLIDKKWYYFDGSGYMVTGWRNIKNKWYYFYPSGHMARNTYINKYYVNNEGVWIVAK